MEGVTLGRQRRRRMRRRMRMRRRALTQRGEMKREGERGGDVFLKWEVDRAWTLFYSSF